jgi:hypothetical protein
VNDGKERLFSLSKLSCSLCHQMKFPYYSIGQIFESKIEERKCEYELPSFLLSTKGTQLIQLCWQPIS